MANWDLYEKRIKLSGSNTRDREINAMSNALINDFDNVPSYRKAYFNGLITTTDIQVIDGKTDNVKTIYMKPDGILNVGDILAFDSEDWLCISVNKNNPVNQIGTVSKCTNTLSLYKNHILITIPCIVGKVNMDIEKTKYMNLLNNDMIITVPNNATTALLEESDVMKIGRKNYQITGIDDISKQGLLELEYKLVTEEIPIEIPIPSPILNGVQISGESTITKGYTSEFRCVFKVDGNIVNDESVFYLTDVNGNSTNLATITTQDGILNTCMITGISLGLVKLWCKNVANTVVSQAFDIKIQNIF